MKRTRSQTAAAAAAEAEALRTRAQDAHRAEAAPPAQVARAASQGAPSTAATPTTPITPAALRALITQNAVESRNRTRQMYRRNCARRETPAHKEDEEEKPNELEETVRDYMSKELEHAVAGLQRSYLGANQALKVLNQLIKSRNLDVKDFAKQINGHADLTKKFKTVMRNPALHPVKHVAACLSVYIDEVTEANAKFDTKYKTLIEDAKAAART